MVVVSSGRKGGTFTLTENVEVVVVFLRDLRPEIVVFRSERGVPKGGIRRGDGGASEARIGFDYTG